MSDSGEGISPNEAIGAYVFAADWIDARAVVASDPWFATEEAREEMARLLEAAREGAAQDRGAELTVPLFVVADERLRRLASDGLDAAFDDLVSLDSRLKDLVATVSTLDELCGALAAEETLVDERTVGALRQWLMRTIVHENKELGRRIGWFVDNLEPVVENGLPWFAGQVAAMLARELQRVEANDVTPHLVERTRRALSRLSDQAGSPVYLHLAGELRRLLRALPPEARSEAAIAEVADATRFIVLAVRRLRTGDLDAELLRAIAAQKEVLDLLRNDEDAPPSDPARWAAGMHDLGVCYFERRTGVRSQNVDRAVTAFEAALPFRSVETDRAGRARTLRALSHAYPEWSGADSLGHAQDLARAAADEAEAIDPRTTPREELPGLQSALRVDLDDDVDGPSEARRERLEAIAAHHRTVLESLAVDEDPVRWAEWMGGLARVLGALRTVEIVEHVDEAYRSFESALAAVANRHEPRLVRDLYGRMGELAHGLGHWATSLEAHRQALAVNATLTADLATRESVLAELSATGAFPLFAAYAAFREGSLEDAVRFAELERARSLADVFHAAEVLPSLPADARAAVERIIARIGELEAELDAAEEDDPEAVLRDMRNRLADVAGVQPDQIGVRLVNEDREATAAATARRADVMTELARTKEELGSILARSSAASRGDGSGLGAEKLLAIAREAGLPLVYVLVTMHGGVALVVPPAGELAAVPLAITSEGTRALLHDSGFERGAFHADLDALRSALGPVLSVLRERVMSPIGEWLRGQGHGRAVLVPTGSLGLLPLHAAVGPGIVCSLAISARAVSLALASRRTQPDDLSVLAVAAPARDGEAPLPFASVEARGIAHFMSVRQETGSGSAGVDSPVTVLGGDDATAARVRTAAGAATIAHFACHGKFRPSDPLQSHLLLAGDDRLAVADVFARTIDLSRCRLVVFSACQTGNVEYYDNPDEVLGFPAALLLAGVPLVLTTLWPVDDAATALLCLSFYERLFAHGDDAPTALAAASEWLRSATAARLQERVEELRATLDGSGSAEDVALSNLWRSLALRDPDDVPFAAPEYWAAFVLSGV